MNTVLIKADEFSVEKGPTVLYKRTKVRGSDIPHYAPFTLEDHTMLITIRQALLGDKRAQESSAFLRAHIRFGWIEPGFNSLQWMSVSSLYHGYYHNTLTPTAKRKFMELAKVLFISIRQVSREVSAKESIVKAKRRVRNVA